MKIKTVVYEKKNTVIIVLAITTRVVTGLPWPDTCNHDV
jgi:hypothetical protein